MQINKEYVAAVLTTLGIFMILVFALRRVLSKKETVEQKANLSEEPKQETQMPRGFQDPK